MGLVFETPDKLNHADTILYEIYMLRFAAHRLLEHHQQANWRDQKDAWVYLEAFLLHYRNLIEFLGKPNTQPARHKRRRADTLTVMTIWKLLNVAEPGEASQIQKEGEELYAKYEHDCISRYVSHPTTERIKEKSWRIDEMSQKIEPLLAAVEAALRPLAENPLVKPFPAVPFLGPHEGSATVSTNTSPRDEIKPIDPPKQYW